MAAPPTGQRVAQPPPRPPSHGPPARSAPQPLPRAQASKRKPAFKAPRAIAAPVGNPYISVITATYNAMDHLPAFLDNIAAQTCDDFEFLVQDGASTDGTVAYLEEHIDNIAHFESAPDDGIYDAWNKAIVHARGRWICFVGVDDRFATPHALAAMLAHLRQAERDGIRFVYGQVDWVDPFDQQAKPFHKPWPQVRALFRDDMPLIHAGGFHHHSQFDEHGQFDPSFTIVGDYEFLLRDLRDHDARFVPDVTVLRHDASGVSSNPANRRRVFAQMRRARRKNGLRRPSWVLLRREAEFVTRQAFVNRLGEARVRDLEASARKLLRRG